MIVERQASATWGKAVVEQLSKNLRVEFPSLRGFSVQNLWTMRQFFCEYQDHENLQPLVGEIGWTHNVIIFQRCKDLLEREFYIRMTRKMGWSKNVLIHQMSSALITTRSPLQARPTGGRRYERPSRPHPAGSSSITLKPCSDEQKTNPFK